MLITLKITKIFKRFLFIHNIIFLLFIICYNIQRDKFLRYFLILPRHQIEFERSRRKSTEK